MTPNVVVYMKGLSRRHSRFDFGGHMVKSDTKVQPGGGRVRWCTVDSQGKQAGTQDDRLKVLK